MRVLIVEDNDEIVEVILSSLAQAGVAVDLSRAATRIEAEELIVGDAEFDLGIFDLKIPSDHGIPDEDPSYGRAMFHLAAEQRPGMMAWVLSGFADEDFLEELISDPRTGDIFGTGTQQSLVACHRKKNLAKMVEAVVGVGKQLHDLGLVDLSMGGQIVELSGDEQKLLRILLRRHGASVGQLKEFKPGLSGSRAFHVKGIGDHGQQVLNCVVKVGPRGSLLEEENRFRDGVAGVLTAGCFAPLSEALHFGAGSRSLLCYSLAGADPVSLLDLLVDSEQRAIGVLNDLRTNLAVWVDGGFVETVQPTVLMSRLGASPLDDLAPERRPECDDERVAALMDRELPVRTCTQHGDLHLGNVLIAPGDRPILIDFGRTTSRTAPYDAVVLELGLFFHPDGREQFGDWPSAEQAASFDDLDDYLVDCPTPDFVRACRAWAHESAVSDREVWFAVLAVALRQLRFPDPPERARAVATRAIELLT